MSFIDLMADDIWTDTDILRRTEAMIRSEFSAEAETVLNRKAVGAALGAYTPSEAEQAEMARYHAVVDAARIAGVEARADMALLLEALRFEDALRRLEVQNGDSLDPEAAATAAAERTDALAIVDAASPEVVNLVARRRSRG